MMYENYNDSCIKESGQTPELFREFERLYVADTATRFRNPANNARELFDGENTQIIIMSPAPAENEFVIR